MQRPMTIFILILVDVFIMLNARRLHFSLNRTKIKKKEQVTEERHKGASVSLANQRIPRVNQV
jgi:predicted RND superfamily exporter protein